VTTVITTWRHRYAEDVSADEEFANWRWPKMTNIETGTVLSWIDEGGFGFVHAKWLIGASLLIKSQRVEYTPTFDQERQKYRAIDVRVIG
jgi:hypothetical protein